jgi:hypothetical protein
MSDEVNYQSNWALEAEQCKNCAQYQEEGGKHACVPPDKTFAAAIEEYGEVSPVGHCNYFQSKV